jgi:hypothetical protein
MIDQDWEATPRAVMDTPPPELRPASVEGRLDSWKKIAVYLKRDVTTVQRWEKREGMPVHRHLHDKTGSVYAFRSELDAWAHGRRERRSLGEAQSSPSESGAALEAAPALETAAAPASTPSSTSPVRRPRLLFAAAIAAVALVVLVWLERSDRFWRDPIAGATYQSLTGFDAQNEAADLSGWRVSAG